MLGLNLKDQDALAKQREQVLHFLNGHEVALANIPYLIHLCPNGHEVALVRSLEPFHRLVWLYLIRQYFFFLLNSIEHFRLIQGISAISASELVLLSLEEWLGYLVYLDFFQRAQAHCMFHPLIPASFLD